MNRHEFLLPDLGEGIGEAEVIRWLAQVGERVAAHAPLVEVQTDKALVELPAPVSGVVVAHGVEVGGILKLGEPVAVFEVENGVGPRPDQRAGLRPLAAPTVRQAARELGVDLSAVAGSGSGGRILREDVEQAADGTSTVDPVVAAPAVAGSGTQATPVASVSHDGTATRTPLRGLRRTIARRLTETVTRVPMVSNLFEADVTDLGTVLDELRPVAAAEGVNLTWTALFALAAIQTVTEFPQFNASLDEEREEVVQHHAVHLGVATATSDGLIVPVVRGASARALLDLACEISQVTGAARDRTAPATALTGSTFTISNYGSVGGWFGTPVLNVPEAAIAGFGEVALRSWVVNGGLAVRSVVPVSVTVDHRLIDGALNAQFGTALRRRLEQPSRLLLGARHGDG